MTETAGEPRREASWHELVFRSYSPPPLSFTTQCLVLRKACARLSRGGHPQGPREHADHLL